MSDWDRNGARARAAGDISTHSKDAGRFYFEAEAPDSEMEVGYRVVARGKDVSFEELLELSVSTSQVKKVNKHERPRRDRGRGVRQAPRQSEPRAPGPASAARAAFGREVRVHRPRLVHGVRSSARCREIADDRVWRVSRSRHGRLSK